MKACAGVEVLTRRRFLLGAAALAAGARIAPARAATLVNVEREGDEVHVQAHAEIDAALAQAWSTLADYDRLAEFIPDMLSSRTLTRSGTSAVIEQRAQATFGPFHRGFRLVLAVEEATGESIRAAAVDGDFRRFDARYDVAAIDARRTRIDYRAALLPSTGVPPLIGVAVMRSLIRRQFEAMLGEIDRRATINFPPPPAGEG